MAEYVGIIAFILCIVHFIYQTIILPSVRQSARDDLFKLRDELRHELIEVQSTSDKNTVLAFKEIDDGINRSLNRLHVLNFSTFIKVSLAISKSPEKYKKSKQQFEMILANSDSETPKEIYTEVNKILHRVLVLNSAMFTFYLLPFALVGTLISSVYKRIKYGTDVLVDICIGRESTKKLLA